MARADRMRKSIGRRPLLAGAAGLGGLAAMGGVARAAGGPPLEGDMADWVLEAAPPPVPGFGIRTPEDDLLGPDAFAGRLILMNFWATWCEPCVAEMPSLNSLQAAYADRPMEVVAVSIDRGGMAAVEPFFEKKGLTALRIYLDPTGNTPVLFEARGVPTTILISPDSRILGRLTGDAHWDSPQAHRFVDHFLAETSP